jgi:hypothetical protein
MPYDIQAVVLKLKCTFESKSARAVDNLATPYLVINVFFGVSSGDHSLKESSERNHEPVLDPPVSLE